MQPSVPLTAAQQKVVEHDKGPALVFAVAGAGKTTAMVHRIERLVRDEVFPASHILATSFGKGNERDLSQKLQTWPHCRHVKVRTLHSLGRSFIAAAKREGYWPGLSLNGHDEESSAPLTLLRIAIYEARRRQVPYVPELDSIDHQDFLTYVAACKGNLLYADLGRARLPPEAREVAGQARAPEGELFWYLNLYRLFEEVRLARGVVTFSDMLMTGWETLVRHPDVLAQAQERYRCVLVDEYQDINRAQAEILDLLTAPERHYMAIGDDDQTIYEWRGANPRFILNFAQRYGAQTYVIDDNFRCPAAPLLLANRVIAHNEERQEKELSLTRGFAGEATLQRHSDASAMARRIVSKMEALREQGHAWDDMAVLVRLNAQTPYLEQALIAADIPFRVSKPFYDRWEIKTLIYYVRLAWVERALQDGNSLTPQQKEWFSEAWGAVYNRPKRYLSRAFHDQVQRAVTHQDVRPSGALSHLVSHAPHDGIAENMEFLAEDIAWLADNLESDAAQTLSMLESRLSYKSYLRESSGFPQTGEGRAVGVEAFIDYARGKGSLLDFVQHIRELAQEKIGRDRSARDDAVNLTTIHGAKGLEWPIVFIAGCNQDIMPFNGEETENMEEERRLFYVALTRSSQHLYLHAVKGEPLSQFLREASWRQLLSVASRLQTILESHPQQWQAQEAWSLARSVHEYNLGRYFRQWWDAPASQKQAVAQAVLRFLRAIEARDAWQALSLPPAVRDTWQPLAGEAAVGGGEDGHFPGLQKLIGEKRQDPSSEPAEGDGDRPWGSGQSTEPEVVRPGMWVRCDAGWGRVERITDRAGQPVAQMPRKARMGRLHLTLRPGLDAIPLEIDLDEERILFPENGRFYTCTRCHRFSSPDAVVVSRDHNDVAHDGVGASYRPEKKGFRPLKHLFFQEEAPRRMLG